MTPDKIHSIAYKATQQMYALKKAIGHEPFNVTAELARQFVATCEELKPFERKPK